MGKVRTYLLNAALICFGLLVGLAVAEIALGILHRAKRGAEFENLEDLRDAMLHQPGKGAKHTITLGDLVMPSVDDQIIYELKPGLDVQFMRARVRTNSYGMRGPEYSLEKPAGTFRIALIGDSFAFGWGVEEEESFASVLERNLNRLSGGFPKFEVLNFAVPGYSTFQEVELFKEKSVCFDPDAVLVYFVQNDFGLPFFVRDIRGKKEETSGLFSALEFSRLTWQAANPHAQEELAKMQGWDPNASLNRLALTTDEMGIPLYVAINPKKSQKKDISRLPSIRKRDNVFILDLREGMLLAMRTRGIDAKTLTLSFDPHPSPLRHQILGDLMTPWLWAAADGFRRP